MTSLSAAYKKKREDKAEPRSKLHEAIAKYNKGLIAGNVAQGATAPMNNVLRDLNLESERVARFRNKQAQEDPDGFVEDREIAIGDMEKQIENAYMNSYSQYIQAGKPEDEAKKKAMVVAKSTKEALEEAIKCEFGTDAKIIAQSKKIVRSAQSGLTNFGT
jgi:hypothetical protein